jgi:molybdenum cofactor cytidylyltransferase
VNARYAAIIPAAGLSTRMRSFKPLLSLGKETITDHIISTFYGSGVDVFLVVGHRRDEIKTRIVNREITIVDNPDYQQGMFSSIRAGVSRLGREHEAFFILPADIPLVRPATIERLMNAASQNPGKIVYPVFRGKRGHPPLIPSSAAPAILGWNGEGGLKAALNSQENPALEMPVADSNILFDVDTAGDFEEMLRRFQSYDLPTDEECGVILNDICKVAPDRVRHCYKVAEVAAALGKAFNAAGKSIDPELIRKAAILHDIAKGLPRHDMAGGQILREMGFGKVGDMVAVHSDLSGGNTRLPIEAKMVYLADKLVEGERLVSLEERYGNVNRRQGKTPDIEAIIMGRLKVALSVKQEFEKVLGYPLENIIRPSQRQPL